jgi:RimJ/RimL family protein N-acetyltransferase
MFEKNNIGQPIGTHIVNWKGCPWPPKKSINGNYCKLEPLSISEHSKELFEVFIEDSDGHNWTYLPYGPFSDLKSFCNWLKGECLKEDPQFQVIIDKRNNKPVGMASYLRINPAVGVIEVGHIHYSNKMQKTCIATEAMYLMMARVFDDLGYRRYEWKCDALNEKSCRAAKRLGFTFEGVFRQATIYKGRNRDTAWYSVLNHEWPRIKKSYDSWLSASNFDNSGKQLNSLNFL